MSSDTAKTPQAKKADAPAPKKEEGTIKTNDDGTQVVIPPDPPNPLAEQIATGTVSGISGAPTEPGIKQDSEEAKQPDITGEINESVVNPVAPPVEPQGVPEAVVRAVAVPKAQEEPTFHDGADYNRLKAAFLKLCDRGNEDGDFIRSLKREAGIL